MAMSMATPVQMTPNPFNPLTPRSSACLPRVSVINHDPTKQSPPITAQPPMPVPYLSLGGPFQYSDASVQRLSVPTYSEMTPASYGYSAPSVPQPSAAASVQRRLSMPAYTSDILKTDAVQAQVPYPTTTTTTYQPTATPTYPSASVVRPVVPVQSSMSVTRTARPGYTTPTPLPTQVPNVECITTTYVNRHQPVTVSERQYYSVPSQLKDQYDWDYNRGGNGSGYYNYDGYEAEDRLPTDWRRENDWDAEDGAWHDDSRTRAWAQRQWEDEAYESAWRRRAAQERTPRDSRSRSPSLARKPRRHSDYPGGARDRQWF
mmetsp:Transcript_109711/g.186580  ORF Transcript_109711/g.186580 Transcript_109711/m.186580 type:complete len:318 (+) Transcript_109711:55-1008(+)